MDNGSFVEERILHGDNLLGQSGNVRSANQHSGILVQYEGMYLFKCIRVEETFSVLPKLINNYPF